jgi:hypothetical protein
MSQESRVQSQVWLNMVTGNADPDDAGNLHCLQWQYEGQSDGFPRAEKERPPD